MFFCEFAIDEISHPVKLKENEAFKEEKRYSSVEETQMAKKKKAAKKATKKKATKKVGARKKK